MNLTTPDLIAYGLMAGVVLTGVLLLGWLLGMNDRDQKDACEMSQLRTRLAQTEWLLAKSRANSKVLADDLHIANERIRHLQESNQSLVLRAVLPPEVRRGG